MSSIDDFAKIKPIPDVNFSNKKNFEEFMQINSLGNDLIPLDENQFEGNLMDY
jgi:hypothetical protein